MTDLLPGTKVRVTFKREGVITEHGHFRGDDPDDFVSQLDLQDRFEVEVLEEPPFKPGDLVRSKQENCRDYYFLLGEKHYHSFTPHGSRVWKYGGKTDTIAEFPRHEYELVEVG
jgi:hypothetical protein